MRLLFAAITLLAAGWCSRRDSAASSASDDMRCSSDSDASSLAGLYVKESMTDEYVGAGIRRIDEILHGQSQPLTTRADFFRLIPVLATYYDFWMTDSPDLESFKEHIQASIAQDFAKGAFANVGNAAFAPFNGALMQEWNGIQMLTPALVAQIRAAWVLLLAAGYAGTYGLLVALVSASIGYMTDGLWGLAKSLVSLKLYTSEESPKLVSALESMRSERLHILLFTSIIYRRFKAFDGTVRVESLRADSTLFPEFVPSLFNTWILATPTVKLDIVLTHVVACAMVVFFVVTFKTRRDLMTELDTFLPGYMSGFKAFNGLSDLPYEFEAFKPIGHSLDHTNKLVHQNIKSASSLSDLLAHVRDSLLALWITNRETKELDSFTFGVAKSLRRMGRASMSELATLIGYRRIWDSLMPVDRNDSNFTNFLCCECSIKRSKSRPTDSPVSQHTEQFASDCVVDENSRPKAKVGESRLNSAPARHQVMPSITGAVENADIEVDENKTASTTVGDDTVPPLKISAEPVVNSTKASCAPKGRTVLGEIDPSKLSESSASANDQHTPSDQIIYGCDENGNFVGMGDDETVVQTGCSLSCPEGLTFHNLNAEVVHELLVQHVAKDLIRQRGTTGFVHFVRSLEAMSEWLKYVNHSIGIVEYVQAVSLLLKLKKYDTSSPLVSPSSTEACESETVTVEAVQPYTLVVFAQWAVSSYFYGSFGAFDIFFWMMHTSSILDDISRQEQDKESAPTKVPMISLLTYLLHPYRQHDKERHTKLQNDASKIVAADGEEERSDREVQRSGFRPQVYTHHANPFATQPLDAATMCTEPFFVLERNERLCLGKVYLNDDFPMLQLYDKTAELAEATSLVILFEFLRPDLTIDFDDALMTLTSDYHVTRRALSAATALQMDLDGLYDRLLLGLALWNWQRPPFYINTLSGLRHSLSKMLPTRPRDVDILLLLAKFKGGVDDEEVNLETVIEIAYATRALARSKQATLDIVDVIVRQWYVYNEKMIAMKSLTGARMDALGYRLKFCTDIVNQGNFDSPVLFARSARKKLLEALSTVSLDGIDEWSPTWSVFPKQGAMPTSPPTLPTNSIPRAPSFVEISSLSIHVDETVAEDVGVLCDRAQSPGFDSEVPFQENLAFSPPRHSTDPLVTHVPQLDLRAARRYSNEDLDDPDVPPFMLPAAVPQAQIDTQTSVTESDADDEHCEPVKRPRKPVTKHVRRKSLTEEEFAQLGFSSKFGDLKRPSKQSSFTTSGNERDPLRLGSSLRTESNLEVDLVDVDLDAEPLRQPNDGASVSSHIDDRNINKDDKAGGK